ncbi:MAG: hypothetical protein LBN02_00705 [Oscillospiraceae bacterium]|jgi:hypothetical protein|nr:hypothetical protein [Oscillospiraceae bacterium]
MEYISNKISDDGELKSVVNQFLQTEQGQTFNAHRDEISAVAQSREGERVLKSLSSDELRSAVKRGDTDTMLAEVSKALSTPEGARFYAQIQQIFNK